jgi:hypothetical protein
MFRLLFGLLATCVLHAGAHAQVTYGFELNEKKKEETEDRQLLQEVILQTKEDFLGYYGFADSNRKLIELFDKMGAFAPGARFYGRIKDLPEARRTVSRASSAPFNGQSMLLIVSFENKQDPYVGGFSRSRLLDYLEGNREIPRSVRRARDRIKLPNQSSGRD